MCSPSSSTSPSSPPFRSSRGLRHTVGNIFDRSESPSRTYSTPSKRPSPPRPFSLPAPQPGYHQPFSSARSSSQPRSSPLGRSSSFKDGDVGNGSGEAQERTQPGSKNEERRWRIALELRDTERAYFQVLNEIEQVSHYTSVRRKSHLTRCLLNFSTTTNLFWPHYL